MQKALNMWKNMLHRVEAPFVYLADEVSRWLAHSLLPLI